MNTLATTRWIVGACALVVVTIGGGGLHAQTLSGIVQFSTDATGSVAGGQFWDTVGGDGSYNLYVSQGGPLLNSGNAAATSINVALSPGTYNYALYTEPGGNTGFSYAGINLFFNGNVATPGISVFGPINTTGGSPNGGTTVGLDETIVTPGANRLSTTVGGMIVTLSNFRFNSPASSDLVSAYNNVPSGASDFVTTFTLTVTPAAQPSVAVPTLSGPGLALLALLVGTLAWLMRRRRETPG